MSEVNVLFGRKTSVATSAGLRLLTFDAVLSEDHTYKNQVTNFPVENGIDISDHIRQEPERLKLEGIITASPLDGEPGTQRWLDAYETLLGLTGRKMIKSVTEKQIGGKPQLVDIVSGVRVWTDMAIENLESKRDNQTGDALRVSIDLVNVRKATLETANVLYVNKKYGAGLADQEADTEDTGENQTETPGFVADPKDSWALQGALYAQQTGRKLAEATMSILGGNYGVNLNAPPAGD